MICHQENKRNSILGIWVTRTPSAQAKGNQLGHQYITDQTFMCLSLSPLLKFSRLLN